MAAALCARRIEPDSEVVLVTGDIGDFEGDAAAGREVDVVDPDPDRFVILLMDRDPVRCCGVVQRRPTHRYRRFLQLMRDDGLPETADGIQRWFRDMQLSLY